MRQAVVVVVAAAAAAVVVVVVVVCSSTRTLEAITRRRVVPIRVDRFRPPLSRFGVLQRKPMKQLTLHTLPKTMPTTRTMGGLGSGRRRRL